jgi:hypothetical protein
LVIVESAMLKKKGYDELGSNKLFLDIIVYCFFVIEGYLQPFNSNREKSIEVF